MKKIIFLVVILSIPFLTAAQGDFRPGYIITNSNDSISGYVKYKIRRSAATSCEFRRERRGKTETYRPDQIRAYAFFGNKKFVSRTIRDGDKTKEVFLDQLVWGKLSLLRSIDIFYLEAGDTLMKLKPRERREMFVGGRRMSRISKIYKGQLNYVLRECQLSAENIEYEDSDLTAIIQNYNRCKGAEGVVYKERIPGTRVGYSIFGGLHGSKLIIDQFDNNSFNRSWSPAIGGGLNLSAPRIFDRVYFSLEAFHTKKTYTGTTLEDLQHRNEYNDTEIKFPSFQFALGIQYNLKKETNTPYVRAAFGYYVNGKGSMSVITEAEENGRVITSTAQYDYDPLKQQSLVAAFGYQKALYAKSRIFMEVRYERSAGFFGFDQMRSASNVNNACIFAGLRF